MIVRKKPLNFRDFYSHHLPAVNDAKFAAVPYQLLPAAKLLRFPFPRQMSSAVDLFITNKK